MAIIIKYWKLFMLACALILIFSCQKEPLNKSFYTEESQTISDYLKSNQERFSSFWQIILETELNETLNAYNPHGDGYTLFLPTNDAFNKFLDSHSKYKNLEDLLADSDFINELVRYHILNSSINTNEFPFGALPDTTVSGDLLTIGFSSNIDTTIYKVNNEAPIIEPNILLSNGIIHVINEVLEPITLTSYEWLLEHPGFKIITGAFELTGLDDTLGLYRTNAEGQKVKNEYTLLVENDSVFHKSGIYSLDDLIERFNTPSLDYSNTDNGLYQFAAYHILENIYFLDQFSGTDNYNSYASFPVQISSGIDIQINKGVDSFGLKISGQDTTLIDYLSLYYQSSNVLTRNGAIHFLNNILTLYKPTRTIRIFQFYEEPIISSVKGNEGIYEFLDPNDFEVIYWTGPEKLTFVKNTSNEKANNKDYLEIEGNFTLDYQIPKILPGKYSMFLRFNANSTDNAIIMVFLDGKQMGSNFDLTSGGSTNNPYKEFFIGSVDFSVYSGHVVHLESLIPGRLIWDYVKFIPE